MNNLLKHLEVFPLSSQKLLMDTCQNLSFELKIKKSRLSKLGDFRYPIKDAVPEITLNQDSNQYRTLVTFIHELAHLLVFLEEGRRRNPHGAKWKRTFSNMLDLYYKQGIFPKPLDEAIWLHAHKPKASSHADLNLLKALREFDPPNEKTILLDLSDQQLFRLKNGKVFQKGQVRRTRVLCQEIDSKRKYLIHGHAEVEAIE